MKNYLKNNKKNYLGGGVTSGVAGNGSAMLGNLSQFLGPLQGMLGGGAGGGTGDLLSLGMNLVPNQKERTTVSNEGKMARQLTESIAGKVAGPLGTVVAKGAGMISDSSLFTNEECVEDVNGETVCYDKNKANAGILDVGNTAQNTIDAYKRLLSGDVKGGLQSAASSLTFGLVKSPLQKEQEQKFQDAVARKNRKLTNEGIQESQLAGLKRKQANILDDQQQGFGQIYLAKKGGSTKKWIQKAVKGFEEKGTKGALTKQAKAAGKSISEFCQSPPSALAKKRCQFRKNVSK